MLPSPHSVLCDQLARLVEVTKAGFSAVVDEGGHLFAWSRVLDAGELARVGSHMDEALASTPGKSLRRGGKVRVLGHAPGRYYVAMSFAGVYVVLLCFEDKYLLGPVMAHLRRALPDIEQLTTSLPPDGPDRARESRPRAARKRR